MGVPAIHFSIARLSLRRSALLIAMLAVATFLPRPAQAQNPLPFTHLVDNNTTRPDGSNFAGNPTSTFGNALGGALPVTDGKSVVFNAGFYSAFGFGGSANFTSCSSSSENSIWSIPISGGALTKLAGYDLPLETAQPSAVTTTTCIGPKVANNIASFFGSYQPSPLATSTRTGVYQVPLTGGTSSPAIVTGDVISGGAVITVFNNIGTAPDGTVSTSGGGNYNDFDTAYDVFFRNSAGSYYVYVPTYPTADCGPLGSWGFSLTAVSLGQTTPFLFDGTNYITSTIAEGGSVGQQYLVFSGSSPSSFVDCKNVIWNSGVMNGPVPYALPGLPGTAYGEPALQVAADSGKAFISASQPFVGPYAIEPYRAIYQLVGGNLVKIASNLDTFPGVTFTNTQCSGTYASYPGTPTLGDKFTVRGRWLVAHLSGYTDFNCATGTGTEWDGIIAIDLTTNSIEKIVAYNDVLDQGQTTIVSSLWGVGGTSVDGSLASDGHFTFMTSAMTQGASAANEYVIWTTNLNALPTQTTISAAPSSQSYLQNVTLSATVTTQTGSDGPPTGSVQFLDGTTVLSTQILDSGGSATMTLNSLAVGTHSISVQYEGADLYELSTSAVLPVTITPAALPAPSISWATPAPLTYGTALGAAQLDATASVPGTFVYTPALGSLLTAGAQALSVSFTPTDLVHYTTATASVTLIVNPAGSTITWPAPTTITFGTALSAVQLNATASVPGAFTYTPAAGTVLKAGSQTLSVTFVPTDTVDYTTVTSTVTQVVNPATPSITWPTPPAISYGTALSTTQLNATSQVAGTFTYSPVLGTVLKAGTQTLSVSFVPTDATDYTSGTLTTSLTVNPAILSVTANNAAMTYGGALPTLTSTISGFVNGDSHASTVTGVPAISAAGSNSSPAGSYAIKVSQGTLAAASYSFTFVNGTLTIGKAPLTVTAQNATKVYGAALPSFSDVITGFVNGDTSAQVSGFPSFTTTAASSSPVGPYPVVISVGSLVAANYTFNTANGTLTVTRAASSAALAASPNPSATGQTVSFAATVTPQAGGTATGTVTFTDGATLLGSSPVVGNAAALSVSTLAAGAHTIVAAYGGDSNVLGATSAALSQTVTASTSNATTTTITTSVNPAYVTQPITYTALVASSGGVPGGIVTFKQGTATLSTVPFTGGVASYTTSYATAGTRIITAVFAASGSFTGSTSGALSQAVRSLPAATTTAVTSSGSPSNVGQAVTFTATVSATFGKTPNGETVTFTDGGGVKIGTAILTGDVASLTTSSLPAGTHPIRAVYAGDATYAPSTSAVISQVVVRYQTTALLSSTPNPSEYGQSVSLTALVTSSGQNTPTGTATFKDGTTNLATVTLVGGAATLSRSNLSAGTHSITVVYNGDPESAISSSSVLAQQVTPATTNTTIRTSVNPSRAGQNVRFTATIRSTTGPVPTGTVTFTTGASTLGTATLAGGTASISTATLPSGITAVTATYNGNANLGSSTASLNQTVR
jgi:hypothetical protein